MDPVTQLISTLPSASNSQDSDVPFPSDVHNGSLSAAVEAVLAGHACMDMQKNLMISNNENTIF